MANLRPGPGVSSTVEDEGPPLLDELLPVDVHDEAVVHDDDPDLATT